MRTGRPPSEGACGKPSFQHLGETPRESELFNAGVAAFAPGADELCATDHDFPAAGAVIDIGGGIGGVLLEIRGRTRRRAECCSTCPRRWRSTCPANSTCPTGGS